MSSRINIITLPVLLLTSIFVFQNCSLSKLDDGGSSSPSAPSTPQNSPPVVGTSIVNAVCSNSSSLTLNPQNASIVEGGGVPLTACGGKAPYTYSILTPNSSGAILGGIYYGPTVPLHVTLQVTDANGAIAQTIVNVGGSTATNAIQIISDGTNLGANATLPIAAKGSMNLAATGGVAPYSFVKTGTGTMSNSIFTAPFAEELDKLIVFDSVGNWSTIDIAVAACGGPNTVYNSSKKIWTLTNGEPLPWCTNIYPNNCNSYPGSVPVINPLGQDFGYVTGQPICVGISNLVINPPVVYSYPQPVFTALCPYSDEASCAPGWTVTNTFTGSGHDGQCQLVTGETAGALGFTFGIDGLWGLCF